MCLMMAVFMSTNPGETEPSLLSDRLRHAVTYPVRVLSNGNNGVGFVCLHDAILRLINFRLPVSDFRNLAENVIPFSISGH